MGSYRGKFDSLKGIASICLIYFDWHWYQLLNISSLYHIPHLNNFCLISSFKCYRFHQSYRETYLKTILCYSYYTLWKKFIIIIKSKSYKLNQHFFLLPTPTLYLLVPSSPDIVFFPQLIPSPSIESAIFHFWREGHLMLSSTLFCCSLSAIFVSFIDFPKPNLIVWEGLVRLFCSVP